MNNTAKLKKKVLMFEDDPFLTDLFSQKFREAGFDFKSYDSPPDNLVEEVYREKPNLVSMGIMMPGMDGWQAIQLLKKDVRTKNIPIICLTNLGQKEEIDKVIDLGVVDYVLKQRVTPLEYVATIKEYLDNPKNYRYRYKEVLNEAKKNDMNLNNTN